MNFLWILGAQSFLLLYTIMALMGVLGCGRELRCYHHHIKKMINFHHQSIELRTHIIEKETNEEKNWLLILCMYEWNKGRLIP